MPLGLSNVPSTFQHLMHVVSVGFESFCNAYMGDLIVEKLRQGGLTANPSNYCWGVHESRVKSIRKFMKPGTKNDLKSLYWAP